MKKCPFCDEMIDDNLTVCPICGEDLVETPPEHEHVTEELVETEMRECPICGEMINAHLDVCDICGEPTHFHDVQEVTAEEPVMTEETPVSAEEIPVAPVERPAVKQQLPKEKKKTNRNYLIGLIVLLLLCLLGLLYLLFFKGDPSDKATDDTAIEQSADTVSQDPAKMGSLQALLDSVEREMNEDVVMVAKYPDEDRACLYYLFNGELFKYNALNGTEETVNVPMDAETDVVLFAEQEGNSEYIKIDMANENMEHTAFYRLNTMTGKILRVKEEPMPHGAQEAQNPPTVDGKGPGEMPPPPPPGSDDIKVKGSKTSSSQKQVPTPAARNKVRSEQKAEEDVPPPPPSNGPGYRLEPINKGDIPKGNNNGGYHF